MESIITPKTLRIAAQKMRLGEKPSYTLDKTFTRDDIERAWRIAYDRTFGVSGRVVS